MDYCFLEDAWFYYYCDEFFLIKLRWVGARPSPRVPWGPQGISGAPCAPGPLEATERGPGPLGPPQGPGRRVQWGPRDRCGPLRPRPLGAEGGPPALWGLQGPRGAGPPAGEGGGEGRATYINLIFENYFF